MYRLNPSFKYHVLIGVFISLWIFIFTFYIKPFDSGVLNLNWWWMRLGIGFSIIAFICYVVTMIFQDSVYQKIFKWNIGLEIFILLLFLFLNLIATYTYYKSPFLKGIWTFSEFFSATLKSVIIFTPILILARRYILKFIPEEKEIREEQDEILMIKGEYKLDILRIHKSDLISITKTQNYVEVFFIQNGDLSSKLIRSSLKKVHKDFNFLIQVHRSHLINPVHFKSWKSQNIISLTHVEVPISKNYKHSVLSL